MIKKKAKIFCMVFIWQRIPVVVYILTLWNVNDHNDQYIYIDLCGHIIMKFSTDFNWYVFKLIVSPVKILLQNWP